MTPDKIIEAITSWASRNGISLDPSFQQRASKYREVISGSTRLAHLRPEDRTKIFAIVVEGAISKARNAGRHVVTSEDFNGVLYEFKGYKPLPSDPCEEAAYKISLSLRNLQTTISESLRRSLQL